MKTGFSRWPTRSSPSYVSLETALSLYHLIPESARYTLKEDGVSGVFVCGFDLGSYDSSRPLIIDPVLLLYCGYIGGNHNDWGYCIANDAEGCTYLTGRTESSEATFPVHIGHLADLDPLFEGRVEDFDAGADVLRPADLSNPHTEKARHNEKELGSVLAALRDARAKLVERVERLHPEAFGRTALHPRLDVPMRLADSLYFQAEHDDYHLARITELIREPNQGSGKQA